MRSRFRRPGRAAPLAAVLSLAAAVVVAGPSSAALPAGQPAAPSAGQSAGPAGLPGQQDVSATRGSARGDSPVTVTLITGDRVQVRYDADGRASATWVPAPGRAGTTVRVDQDGPDVYVVPQDAEGLLAADILDRSLFNVTALADDRLGTDDRDIPLIVTYTGTAARSSNGPKVPEHADAGPVLESIGGQGLSVEPEAAQDFWASIEPTLAGKDTRIAGGAVHKIWLDAVLEADLDVSVGQIGAPQAWAAGYDGSGTRVAVLDTGYDPTHADLADVVVGSQDFTGQGTVVDGHGHGTHVSSIVAGSGAASGGSYRGVAPGADLLIGKVMADSGTGQASWLIDAMEWAVGQDADVVNMSLSTEVSDGTDPISQALDQLSAGSATLFVATAGNDGPGEQTVKAPGNADSALSVAAVDDSDVLADFSSRGPRPGNFGVKPDIAGPGVSIVAARAAGTAMGEPVDAHYTAASGTSMAAPHVAGAAAILAQRHPDWDGEQLKAALMSSSVPLVDTPVFHGGSGRVDVAAAVTATTFAATGSVGFGRIEYSDADQPAQSRPVTFTNVGSTPVDVQLTATATDAAGEPAPAGSFTLGSPTLSIPAGGSATVELTLDPNGIDPGLYSGQVSAEIGGEPLAHTAFGAYLEPELVDVVVNAVRQDGLPANGASMVDLWNLDTDVTYSGVFGSKDGSSGPVTLRLPVGTYSAVGWIWNTDETGRFGAELAVVTQPEVVVTQDSEILLDGRPASRIDPQAPQPAGPEELAVGVYRTSEQHEYSVHYLMDSYVDVVYATATDPVTRGDFELNGHWELVAPEFALRVAGSGADLAAEYSQNSPRIDGRHSFGLADAGRGTAEDLAGLDLAGTVALIAYADDFDMAMAVQNVADAGAEAALVYFNQPGFFLGWVPQDSPIPSWTIGQAAGQGLLADLESGERLRLRVDGQAVSPYSYDLFRYWNGHVPAGIDRTVTTEELARLDATYYGAGTAQTGGELVFAMRPQDTFALRQAQEIPVPSTRTEWRTPGEISWRQVTYPVSPQDGGFSEPHRQYDVGDRLAADWFAPVVRPGVPTDGGEWTEVGMPGYRTGNQLRVLIPDQLDAGGHYGEALATARLLRDGELVAERDGIYGEWPTVPGSARYRFEQDVTLSRPWWQLSTSTSTAWEFTSSSTSEPTSVGLLQVDYDLRTDLLGRVRPGLNSIGLFLHQQGRTTGVAGSVTLAVSYDDGQTWQDVRVSDRGHGRYTAQAKVPRVAESVGVRVRAVDRDGNVVEQRVDRAVGVRG